jgi:hypothetical protein
MYSTHVFSFHISRSIHVLSRPSMRMKTRKHASIVTGISYFRRLPLFRVLFVLRGCRQQSLIIFLFFFFVFLRLSPHRPKITNIGDGMWRSFVSITFAIVWKMIIFRLRRRITSSNWWNDEIRISCHYVITWL